jgi:oxygen-independent coproporphyrinogen-3 oxidase
MPGVYLSYPFCAQKCTYCNFSSGVFPRGLEPRYREALRAELRACDWPWRPATVYLGGGTPSLLARPDLAALLAEVPGHPWLEATLEAAPGAIAPELVRAWRASGITRVSLGVQSFHAAELARTGRKHNAEVVAREIAILREGAIGNINIDLIAGLSGQTMATWNQSLDWIERLQPPHVSVYMLEVDGGSRLGTEILAGGARYGARDTPSEDLVADLYETAVERLRRAGIERYEISNFARPGCESAHNLKYWRREPYLGFGAGAHSFDGADRWQNTESPAAYAEQVLAGASPVAERTPADPEGERFFLGLRLTQGVAGDWGRFAAPIARRLAEGLLESSGGRLRLTPRGVLLSNELFAEFV